MSAKKLKVVVTRKLPAPVELRLKELFDARLNNDDHPFTQEELVEAMQTADVLVPTVTDKLDGRIMARAGDQLRLIAQFGAGVDNIDVQSAVQRGITVTNTPGVLTDDTADVADSPASGWASSAWGVSVKRLPAAQKPLACRSIITTANRSARASRNCWRRLIGTASTRCSRAWISSR